MKKSHYPFLLGLFCSVLISHAQPSPGPTGPNLDAAAAKLFGENQAFSATMEFQGKDPQKGDAFTMPGKISFDSGKSRFEMDISQMKSSRLSPSAAAQMKEMGMETLVTIGRPDKKESYLVYPGLESYTVNPTTAAAGAPEDFKVETTELGKETVDGHPCVKNKAVVTDKQGAKHESTLWNATDLKNFPIKLVTTENGDTVTMSFKNISFAKPDAKQFEPPVAYTKYDDVSTMMRDQIMKKMSGAFGR
jgi:hypothetical protein